MQIRIAALIALALVLTGCPTRKDPLACQDGSCSHHDELTFCDIDGVYAASELGNECIAPPVGGCNRVEDCDPSSSTPECSSIAEGTEGTCVACTDGTHCEDGEVCDDSTNECMAFTCNPGAAGDATCAAVAASQPYCGADDACVACLQPEHCATATAAICDQTSFVCRGCEAHSECDSNVCGDLSGGECVDPAEIVYVTKGGDDGGDCGAKDDPCATIMEGVSQTTATRSMVLVGVGVYDEQLTFTDETVTIVADGVVTVAKTVGEGESLVAVSGTANVSFAGFTLDVASAFVAHNASCSGVSASLSIVDSELLPAPGNGVESTDCTLALRNTVVRNNAGIGISVDGGSVEVVGSTVSNNAGIGVSVDGGSVEVVGSTVRNNAGIGVSVTGGSVEVVDSTVRNNAGIGVSVTGGSVEVVGSTIHNNDGGGVTATDTVITLVNNFIVFNGDSDVTVPGVQLGGNTSSEQFEFNTIFGNQVAPAANRADGVSCNTVSPVAASNSIVYGGIGGDISANGTCDWTYSNLEGGSGVTNIDADPRLVSPTNNAGDYRLKSDSPCIDAADPAATLDIDIDGEARPQGAGHDMGADEAG